MQKWTGKLCTEFIIPWPRLGWQRKKKLNWFYAFIMLAAMCSGRTGMYDKLTALNFIKFAARAYAFSVFLLNKHAQAHNIIFVQVKKKLHISFGSEICIAIVVPAVEFNSCIILLYSRLSALGLHSCCCSLAVVVALALKCYRCLLQPFSYILHFFPHVFRLKHSFFALITSHRMSLRLRSLVIPT